jgi:hypothetical protein
MIRSDSKIVSARSIRATRRAGAAAIVVVAWCFSAHAQGDSAAARALFTEGRQLAAQHKYEQACPKFEESLRLDSGVGTLFNLADCYEHIGRTASAWARFLDASAGAKAANQTERERIARDRANALEPKLSRLTIEVKAQDAGLDVKRDGQSVGSASFGTAVPIDPGAHVVEASAPGKKTWTTRVQVAANAGKMTVAIPALEDALPAAAVAKTPEITPPAAGTIRATTEPTTLADTPESSHALGAQKTIALVTAGVGVVGIGVGAVFFANYKSKNDQASGICVASDPCTPDDVANHTGLVDDAKKARTLGFVGVGVGGAALVAGAILFLTAPNAPTAPSTGLTAGPFIAQGAVGAQVGGTW